MALKTLKEDARSEVWIILNYLLSFLKDWEFLLSCTAKGVRLLSELPQTDNFHLHFRRFLSTEFTFLRSVFTLN